MATDVDATSRVWIIEKITGSGVINGQTGNIGRSARIEMGDGVGPGTAVTGITHPCHFRQGLMSAVSAGPVGPDIAGGQSAVRRAVVAGSAVCKC